MRACVAVAVTMWLAPVLAAGVHAFWPAVIPSMVIGVALAALVARVTAPALAATLAPALRSRAVAALVALLADAAALQIAGVSVYMADPAQARWSYQSSDPFRVRHSCMTAYFEAMRFCAQPGTNIYEMSLYEPRAIGPLKVDSFHYPPPFLLLPAAVHALRADVFQFRALWFVMQCGILAGAVFGLARWIAGREGAYAAAGGVLALASPQFVYSLQQGNVQSSAMPLGAVALVLLGTGRLAAGAPLLAYVAAAKIFPGILLVYLAAARRWKAVAVVAVSGMAIVALTLGLFGARPFQDFVRHELPRISSGAAFPQTENIGIGVNLSVYGLAVRLRTLGLAVLDQQRGLAVASVYGLLVIALAAAVGWRGLPDLATPAARNRFLQLVLALLILASLRSPFVGFYGYVAVVWLLTLVAAERPATAWAIGWWTATAVFAIVHALLPSPAHAPTPLALVVSSVLVGVALALSGGVVIRAWREGAPDRRARVSYAAARS